MCFLLIFKKNSYFLTSPNLASSMTIQIGDSVHTPSSLMICGWSNCLIITGKFIGNPNEIPMIQNIYLVVLKYNNTIHVQLLL